MANVYYRRIIEGVTVPAIVHNGSYFYITMPVYEDGSMDCWKRIALSDLSRELDADWLATEIPVGETIDIHGLGNYQIIDAEWEHTKESYIAYIQNVVRSMNADMAGLFKETPEQKRRFEKNRVRFGAKGTPYKMTNNFGYDFMDGKSSNVFYKSGESWRVALITAYEDASLAIDAVPGRFFSPGEIRDLFARGALSGNPSGTVKILLPGLGAVTGEALFDTDSTEKLKEIENMTARAEGRPDAAERCQEAYYEYLVWASDENKERLRAAYEAVPEHERMYLGDMDTKDSDYRRILYTGRKREV
jgi:hypothetical protein